MLGETSGGIATDPDAQQKPRAVSRPGTLRQFQFPESTDLQGRVKLCARTRRPAIGDDHGDNGFARITPGETPKEEFLAACGLSQNQLAKATQLGH